MCPNRNKSVIATHKNTRTVIIGSAVITKTTTITAKTDKQMQSVVSGVNRYHISKS